MTSYLIGINVWLALSWGRHPHSSAAHKWLRDLPNASVRLLFCRVTQLGLLRLLTNELVMGQSVLSIEESLDVFDRWREDPRVEFLGEPSGTENAFGHATVGSAKKSATKVIMDAYLAGFAGAERATLVTLDKALSKLERVPRRVFTKENRGPEHIGTAS